MKVKTVKMRKNKLSTYPCSLRFWKVHNENKLSNPCSLRFWKVHNENKLSTYPCSLRFWKVHNENKLSTYPCSLRFSFDTTKSFFGRFIMKISYLPPLVHLGFHLIQPNHFLEGS